MRSVATNTLIALLTVAIFAIPMAAQAISEAATIFLLIQPSSQAGAMGSAFTAQAQDGFANYWNPAAIAFNKDTKISFMHSNWLQDAGLDDIYYEYLGWNQYFQDIGNLGLSVIFMNYGKQDQTGANNEDLGTFSSYEYAIAGTYAYRYSENLGLGVNFKYIYSKLADTGTGNTDTSGKGQSYAFDLAVKAKNVVVPRLDMGFQLQNIGPDISYNNDSQADPLPRNAIFGLSYRAIDEKYNRLTCNADVSKVLADSWNPQNNSDEIIYGIGGEYLYLDMLALRAGYIWDDAGQIVGPSFGAGFQTTLSGKYRVKIDFAMQQGGELTDYNKTFSAGLEF